MPIHVERPGRTYGERGAEITKGIAGLVLVTPWLLFIGHWTPVELIRSEMEQAGFRLEQDYDFLQRQSFLVFTLAPHAG